MLSKEAVFTPLAYLSCSLGLFRIGYALREVSVLMLCPVRDLVVCEQLPVPALLFAG